VAWIAGIHPVYSCPAAAPLNVQRMFAEILAIKEGMLAPPAEASIFYLRVLSSLASIMSKMLKAKSRG
jgi:hypothetical protein